MRGFSISPQEGYGPALACRRKHELHPWSLRRGYSGDGGHFALGARSPRPGRSRWLCPSSPTCGACLRAAEGEGGWVSTVALVAGASGVLLKLATHAPELAIHRDGIAKGTQLHKALDDTAGAATLMSLYPLAVNAAFVYASFVPALLLFLLWTLVTSIVLLRRAWGATARVAYAT
jgi:hypothetical protein